MQTQQRESEPSHSYDVEICDENYSASTKKAPLSLRRLKRRLIATVIIVVLLLACLAGVWLAGRASTKDKIQELQDKIQEMIDNPIVLTPVAPVISLDVLNEELKTISELSTAEYLFTDSMVFSDSKQIGNWKIPGTAKSFIMRCEGAIKAGVDIGDVELKVNESQKKIIVSIPEAEILTYEIFNDTVEILDEKNNVFNPISVNDTVEVDTKIENEMKDRAIRSGLLTTAQTNAEQTLFILFMSVPGVAGNYEIEFVTVAK